MVVARLSKAGVDVAGEIAAKLDKAMPFLKDRAKTTIDLVDQCAFILAARPLDFDEKAVKILTAEARERIGRASQALAQIQFWRHEDIKQAILDFATSEGVGFGKVGPVLRAALTGGKPAPDLGVTMEVLGRDETLARLADVS